MMQEKHTLPKYMITIQPNGDIVIINNNTNKTFIGNLNTDKNFKSFCNERALASSMKFCIPEERDKITLSLITTIVSTEKAPDGSTIINVPRNPILLPFSVKDSDFEFLPGYQMTYKDTYPEQIEIGGPNGMNIIKKHYREGWVSEEKYDYYQLNNMSRAIYDLVIKESNHKKLCDYLHWVEEFATQPERYKYQKEISNWPAYEQMIALVQEYKKVINESIMRPDSMEIDDLTHPECVKNSVVLKDPWPFIPTYMRTAKQKNL